MVELIHISETQELDTLDLSRVDRNTWFVLSHHTILLNPILAKALSSSAKRRPDVAIFYGDAEIQKNNGSREVRLLPDFDETQFFASNYMSEPLLVRGDVMKEIFALLPCPFEEICYRIILHAIAFDYVIARIPIVLSRSREDLNYLSVNDRLSITQAWLSEHRLGWSARIGMTSETIEIFRTDFTGLRVSLVIPTVQTMLPGESKSSIEKLLMSLLKTDWDIEKLSILIGDDSSQVYTPPPDYPINVSVIHTERNFGEKFNYAKKMNFLWRQTISDYVVFLNDDLLVKSSDWLKALMSLATQPRIGGVGARLLFPSGNFQHVGMALGPFGTAAHVYHNAKSETNTYLNLASIQREWSCVTGAVFAVRRTVLEEVGGFDETFALDYNDVDMCLKIRLLGYKIAYTPFCEMIHFESLSRGSGNTPASQTALFLQRWQEWLENDYYYHPDLSRVSSDFQLREHYKVDWEIQERQAISNNLAS